MSKAKKTTLVVVGAVLLSTLAIQASDLTQGTENNLMGLVGESSGPCSEGETLFVIKGRTLCVDTFESSPDENCPASDPKNELETDKNIKSSDCRAISKSKQMPWRFVSFTEAQQMCARSQKRLLTNQEWYAAASGMTDIENKCVVSGKSAPILTGESSCVSPVGIHDLIGNVWEWIDEEVIDGSWNDRALPQTGYVTLVDNQGLALETSDRPDESFGIDYVWINSDGVKGMIRGGFYGSGSDAGLYSFNASIPHDFRTTGVGFRCVRDVY